MTLANELTVLQAKLLARHRLCRDNAMARGAIARETRETLALARRDGAIELLRGPRGRLRAALILAYAPAFYAPRIRRTKALIVALPEDRAALAWVRLALRRHRELLSRDALIQLDGKLSALLPTLEQLGSTIHANILAGDPWTGLRALRHRYGALDWDQVPGLRVEKLRTLAQVRACVALVKSEFGRNPRFGAFVASPENLARNRRKLLGSLRTGLPATFVILDGRDRVKGYFGHDFRPRSRFGRPTAGVELCFDRSIQGRGLSAYAYATLLESMIARGARLYLGGTSQPPVLKLARLMQRDLLAYALDSERPFFPRRYFRYPNPRIKGNL